MNRIPPGHPWSCPTCDVTVDVVRADRHGTVIDLAHEDGCESWAARLRSLVPDLGLTPVATVRPAEDRDQEALRSLFPSW